MFSWAVLCFVGFFVLLCFWDFSLREIWLKVPKFHAFLLNSCFKRYLSIQHILPRTCYFPVSILWCFHVCSHSLQITVGSDCNREIKRHLLLGRKAVTHLDSILKSRDVTLLTKVCIVKAMVFPVVMYGCESWSIKKAEHQRTDAFKLWCWRRLLRVSWITNLSILKEINPEHSLEGLMLIKAQRSSASATWCEEPTH